MMRKLTGLFWATLLCNAVASAQNPDLPVIVPPSPELASLAKIGSADVGMNTGTARYNIPLYEVKAGAISFPVSIAYSTNGVKVNDIASRVGMGWNLIAGGVVTHTVHDEDDLDPATVKLAPPSNFSTHDQNLINYLETAGFDHKDTENDEYGFSVNGISGKFFIDDNGVPRVVSQNGVKITKSGNTFLLTTTEGIKYYFGQDNQYEKTKGYSMNGVGRWEKANTTAWFLTKITSPQGDTVSFSYGSVSIITLRGPSQTAKLAPNEAVYPNCFSCTTSWGQPQMDRVDYETKYLTNITTNNGQQVYFVYEDRPDTSGDKRLTRLAVNVNKGDQYAPIKDYRFEYANYPMQFNWNLRFYLTKLYTQSTEIDPNTLQPTETLVHQFEYNDPAGLPDQRSLNQDHFGFANAANNVNFIPDFSGAAQFETYGPLADRSPDLEKSKKGSLSKIIYPNGGFEKYIYGQNTVAEQYVDSTYSGHESLYGKGTSTRGAVTFTTTFTTNSIAAIKIHHVTYNTPSGPYQGQPNYWEPDGLHEMSQVQIIKVSNSALTYINTHKTYADYTATLTSGIEPNTTYQLKLTVWGTSVTAGIYLDHSPTGTPYWVNEPRCGLRVEKIESYDPVSNKTNKRFFTYATMNEPNKSSGYGPSAMFTGASYPDGVMCNVGTGGGAQTQVPCVKGQLSSGSLMGDYSFGGTPISYRTVIESDDSLMVNGTVEHHFTADIPFLQSVPIFGVTMPGSSSSMQTVLGNAVEIGTSWYKKLGSNFKVIKQKYDVYGGHPGSGYNQTNYIIRKRYSPTNTLAPEDKLLAYDLGQYLFTSAWIHLDSTIVIQFDDNGDNPVYRYVAFEYNNVQHQQPTHVKSTNGKGIVEELINKYPIDYNSSPYTNMVTNNILSPVIESSVKSGGTWLASGGNDYLSWVPGSTIYRPSVTKGARGSTTNDTRVQYYSYDVKGNPTELSKQGGAHVSYLWNHNKTFPVAEVLNASVDEIAFTSFEGDEYGSWNTNGSFQTGGITGKHSFNGVVTRAVNPNKSYVLTAWAIGSISGPNGTSGQLIKTKQGWNLYKWDVANTSAIEVTGNKMDEVRLYPAGALMTSYVFDPFVGISSANDPNDNLTYYEYDGLTRLWIVRNSDREIQKQYQYRYNQTINPCSNTGADWQPTGIKRCVMSNGNYTGEQEEEKRDQNNCSSTYLQTTWVSLGVTGQCEPIPNCTGAGQRVVNGVCEMGTKVLISSVKTGRNWTCTYKWVWSDGYESAPFSVTSSTNCSNVGPLEP